MSSLNPLAYPPQGALRPITDDGEAYLVGEVARATRLTIDDQESPLEYGRFRAGGYHESL